MKKLLTILATTGLLVTAAQGQTLINGLNNGDFDGDTVGGAASVWQEALSGASAVVSSAYAESGSNSLLLDSTGAGAWASPNLFQMFPASEGDIFNLTGSMLGDMTSQTNWGILKIEFKDTNGINLAPASVSIGSVDGAGQSYVGAISALFDSDSPVNTWVLEAVEATAPAGTVEVGFYLLNVNPGSAAPGAGPIYFDSIVATQVPEPATIALLGGMVALGFVLYNRRKRTKA